MTWIVIPARLDSTRLARKPLQDLGGLPLIVRVAAAASRSRLATRVVVATDSDEIAGVVRAHGFAAEVTTGAHRSGTDRIGEVLPAGVPSVVNWQGDEPFLSAADVDRLIEALADAQIVTLAAPISAAQFADPHVVKVVCDQLGDALYFSRQPIPHDAAAPLRLGHIGVYGYQAAALRALCARGPIPMEQCERLEQLRALYLGMKIRVLACDAAPQGIDTPEDLAAARRRVKEHSP